MNAIKRLLVQAIIWFLVWLVIWADRGNPNPFFEENISAYVLQIALIAVLLFVAAPKFLFQKKYLLFIVFSVVVIAIAGYISSLTAFQPSLQGIGPRRPASFPGPQRPPSKLFMHLLMIALAYSVAALMETFIYIKANEQKEIKNKNENLQTELKLLKSQINPHFLFNALNNIYALSVTDSTKTQESISDLSNMLRYVLYDCEQSVVPLEKEIAYIKDYISLFSLKSSIAHKIDFKINIDAEQLSIAPMLLIPFIENAFKHGNIENRDSGYLKIYIKADEVGIYFTVDNSLPVIKKQTDGVGGIGLANAKKRLKILYPKKHDLNIQVREDTYSVTLKIEFDEQH